MMLSGDKRSIRMFVCPQSAGESRRTPVEEWWEKLPRLRASLHVRVHEPIEPNQLRSCRELLSYITSCKTTF